MINKRCGMSVFDRIRRTFLVVATAAAFVGCTKGPVCPGGPGCEPTEGSHTFLIYAVTNNNLWRYIRGNVNMAMEAVRAGLPADTRVLVYWDGLTNYTGESKTVLTEIVKENGEVIERVLKQYGEQDSTDPAVMKAVLQDVQYYAPAEVYGISLHGHGTGWFPPELNNLRQPMSGESYIEHDLRRPDNALTRAYGPDGEEYMSAGGFGGGTLGDKVRLCDIRRLFHVFHRVAVRLEGQCPLHSGFAGGDNGQGDTLSQGAAVALQP